MKKTPSSARRWRWPETSSSTSRRKPNAAKPAGVGLMSGFVVGGDGVAQDYDAWCDTEFGPQIAAQAWSQGGQPPGSAHYRERHTWPTALRYAAVGVGLAVAAAGAMLLYGAVLSPSDSGAATPSSPSVIAASQLPDIPEPPIVMPPWPPKDVGDAGHITHDGAFLHRLRIDLPDGGEIIPDAAISNAHIECDNLARGFTKDYLVAFIIRTHDPSGDGLSATEIRRMLDDDAEFYCPGVGS